jgi:hypothetical protein
VLAHHAAVLEGDPIAGRELEVGDAIADAGGQRHGSAEPVAVQRGEAIEAGAAALDDVLRRAVGVEEGVAVVLPERQLLGEALRDPGVTGQGPVLGTGQFEACAERRQCSDCGECEGESEGGGEGVQLGEPSRDGWRATLRKQFDRFVTVGLAI